MSFVPYHRLRPAASARSPAAPTPGPRDRARIAPARRRRAARVAAALVVACVVARADAAEPDCVPQTQLDATAIDRRVVLVGEAHGTNEIPRFTLGLVCSLVRAGRSVILGVEHSGEQQDALNRYIASQGTAADRRDLVQGVNWHLYSDGRGSVAMLDLVDGMRRLRAQGRRVAILAIDRNENVDVPLRADEAMHVTPADNALLNRIGNESMANGVLYAATLYPDYVVVVLAGYSHTSTRASTGNGPMVGDYRPMGQVIAAQMPVYTIGVEIEGGEQAGVRAGGETIYRLPSGALYVDGIAIDATVRLGRMTASFPARDVVR